MRSPNTTAEVRGAVREFNRYHSPEAEAEITGYDRERVHLEIRGPFCDACGAGDYLDDVAAEMDVDVEVERFGEIEGGLSATYRFVGDNVY